MVTITPAQDTETLAPTKGVVPLSEAWAQLRRIEPLGWGALHYTVCRDPVLTEPAVARLWGCSPLRVRREINVGLGWLSIWTGVESATLLERLRELDASVMLKQRGRPS